MGVDYYIREFQRGLLLTVFRLSAGGGGGGGGGGGASDPEPRCIIAIKITSYHLIWQLTINGDSWPFATLPTSRSARDRSGYHNKQVTKNILYEKVGGIEDLKAIGGVKSNETRSYQKGKCNSPIFSTQTTHALEIC